MSLEIARVDRFALAASSATPGIVRTRLHRWLNYLSWPPTEADDIVLCASEAVSNAVEHAYADAADGTVQVSVRLESTLDPTLSPPSPGLRWVCVCVRDSGDWQPTEPEAHSHRRRGLLVMNALMDEVTVTHDARESGTAVALRSHAVPLPCDQ